LLSLVLSMVVLLSSCAVKPIVVARNTVDIVTLDQINLERDDYEIIDVITTSATVTFNAKKMTSTGENDEFVIKRKKRKGINELQSGILKFGYLSQDVVSNTQIKKGMFGKPVYTSDLPLDPETLARLLATYRLIAEAKAKGADALIVPVRSSDIKAGGKGISIVKTTVSAKAIRLKNN